MTTDPRLIKIGQLELTFLADETTGSPDAVVFQMRIPHNARVPVPHFHRDVDETVYGLSGTTNTTVDGVLHHIRAGDALTIRRGQVHHHANTNPEDAVALAILSPAGIGRAYFEEIAAVVNAGGPPDQAKMKDIMLRHGLIPA